MGWLPEYTLVIFALISFATGQQSDCFCGKTYSCAFPFQDISEILKVGIASTDDRMTQFEGWNVRARVDFVGCVH